ncbi:hypothetical protein [Luteibacter sp.]|uniref:hypothetical protein n=1 Tax=Luteibacter sp. TaxID=1886636 RepID=UPI003F7FDCC3
MSAVLLDPVPVFGPTSDPYFGLGDIGNTLGHTDYQIEIVGSQSVEGAGTRW